MSKFKKKRFKPQVRFYTEALFFKKFLYATFCFVGLNLYPFHLNLKKFFKRPKEVS